MIDVIFNFGVEVVMVRILNGTVFFKTAQFGGALVPLENLKLNKVGVIKEFPDLEGKSDWREQSITRFKEKMKTIKMETKQMDYVIEELIKYGYKPVWRQTAGHRKKRV